MLDRGGLLQVERQAALVAVDRQPRRRHAAVGPFTGQRRTAHILALAAFDLDHIGAEQGELVAAIRAGEHLREVEDADVGERAGTWRHAAFSTRSSRATAFCSSNSRRRRASSSGAMRSRFR